MQAQRWKKRGKSQGSRERQHKAYYWAGYHLVSNKLMAWPFKILRVYELLCFRTVCGTEGRRKGGPFFFFFSWLPSPFVLRFSLWFFLRFASLQFWFECMVAKPILGLLCLSCNKGALSQEVKAICLWQETGTFVGVNHSSWWIITGAGRGK